jgi:two-component system OmpR family sensor kinase
MIIILLGIFTAGFGYFTALHDATEWQDNYLKQISAIYHSKQSILPSDYNQIYVAGDDVDTSLYIKIIDNNTTQLTINKDTIAIAANTEKLVTVNGLKDSYRVHISSISKHKKLIVAQSILERNELVIDNVLNAIIPIFLMVPIIILIIKQYIKQLFKPIKEVSDVINNNNPYTLTPISTSTLPIEVYPIVESLNDLLKKVAQYSKSQQKFIAEAAHELRTPLTALLLHAERLEKQLINQEDKAHLTLFKRIIHRNKHLVSQLLLLAKVQSDTNLEYTNIFIPDVIMAVIEELAPFAMQKNINLGVVENKAIYICGNYIELLVLFRNLIENAIKYSPEGGVIDVAITTEDNIPVVTILDSGNGIPETKLASILEPFYRCDEQQIEGTGLGLSIVKAIIDKMSAQLIMENVKPQGLMVEVKFKGTK